MRIFLAFLACLLTTQAMAFDFTVRCFTQARFRQVAINRNILQQTVDGQGNTIFVPINGWSVDEIGPLLITPAVLDAQGNVVTPAVMDTWWTVNLRILDSSDNDTVYPGEAGDTSGFHFVKSKLVAFIRNQATQTTFNGWRAYEFGTGVNRCQIIDPRDYAPVNRRTWLGGMSW